MEHTSSYVHHSDLQGQPDNVTVMVDGKKLQHLIRPKHKYYTGKGASISSIDAYTDNDEGKTILYAKVRAIHRENPYRLMQLRRQTSGRTARTFFELIANQHLTDVRMAELTLTYPMEVSKFMAENGKKGRTWANTLEKRFWIEAEDNGLYEPGSARSMNLHTWKTEKPIEPHFHHHELVPNYRLVVEPGVIDDDGNQVFRFEKCQWDTGPGGTGGMWSKTQLELAKKLWARVIYRFCRQRGVKVGIFEVDNIAWGNLENENHPKLNVFLDYGQLDKQRGKRWLLHKLNYKARHWSQDYAKYSNENPDCPDPPSWLVGYDNRTKVFGWWANMKNVKGKKSGEEIEKLSPYTAKPMEYIGRYTGAPGLESILSQSGGRLVWVEFVRGQPFEGEYNACDIEWLKSVCMMQSVNGKWYHNFEPPESVDLQGQPTLFAMQETDEIMTGGCISNG